MNKTSSGDTDTATPQSEDASQPDSECDLIMKGGITSGVVYPRLIATLAKRYKFRSIGGTSAGAIAAGACAAAEYQRMATGSFQGFDDLADLPGDLNKKEKDTGRSKLFTLFQPVPALRKHFHIMQGGLNKAPAEASITIAVGMLRESPMLVLLSFVVAGLVLLPVFALMTSAGASVKTLAWMFFTTVLAGIGMALATCELMKRHFQNALIWGISSTLVTLVALGLASGWVSLLKLFAATLSVQLSVALSGLLLVLVVAFFFAKQLLAGLHANSYGICSGLTPADGSAQLPALTDWLTSYFNELAGLKPEAPPLTFAQLWGGSDPAGERRIDLQVMTTAVSQNMAYAIPFRDGTAFYFDPEEWKALFPGSVMKALTTANTASEDGKDDKLVVRSKAGRVLRRLPRAGDLPIVVAVRMSLSFPVLLSAVPLYAIDWSCAKKEKCGDETNGANAGGRNMGESVTATRVWFSDGGIGSNLPLHMFDALLPGRPTFAVNLKAEHPAHKIQTPERCDNGGGRIYMPTNNNEGHQRHWSAPQDEAPLVGFFGFLYSIINTMQNWRDEIQFTYPGFRDRIVQISQRDNEGGLNLDMPEQSITALAHAGEMAAERLIDRFHQTGADNGQGWDNHQSIRLKTFLGVTQPALTALSPGLKTGPWKTFVDTTCGYPEFDADLAKAFLDGLADAGELGIGHETLDRHALKPLAEIRITPRI